jgi:hypothetical protein
MLHILYAKIHTENFEGMWIKLPRIINMAVFALIMEAANTSKMSVYILTDHTEPTTLKTATFSGLVADRYT